MSNPNVDALNDVTKTLIDSQKGYQKVTEVADENHALRAKFQTLAAERGELITAFQTRVREYGGEPVTDGGAAGSVHRAWTDFTSLFSSDEKAALEAVDDGEEYLAERAESKLKEKDLDTSTVELLQRAHASAKHGEKFADVRT
ncbi:PA2169 family four-helix-bundle protein [Henriciella marina]|uniref:PA2169 family four-helix-bundle protein n=1 Tax=Henriciella marina TaxID=453851 RepID=UPI0003A153CB|nr:PA2169 family four-helix-bundle protein [Henriciella marina]